MAAGINQKLKLLYLAKIFMEETDDEHGLDAQQLIQKLDFYGVNEERKTLYHDLAELGRFGFDIISEQVGRNVLYHLGSRDFELPELKLLVDSVQSAKFISEKKSRELIEKIENLVSKHQAKHLHRQVIISGRVKTMNESVYYIVDKIHEAINRQRQIRFHYFQWTVEKKPELRSGGAWYQVSPWSLLWDDEYYYLAAYDSTAGIMKHYRVDKMLDLDIADLPREGEEQFAAFNAAEHSRQVFGMFTGETTRVTIEGQYDMVGALIDRFGQDLTVMAKDSDHFIAYVDVAVSSHFVGWIIALGDGIQITAPESIVSMMRDTTRRLITNYLPGTMTKN